MVSEASAQARGYNNNIGSDILASLPSNGIERENSFEDYVEHMSESATFDVDVEVPDLEESTAPPASRDSSGWNPKKSFLAESPYFSAFVEKEMHELSIVTDVLTDISARTRSFTKYGLLMADATHKLSLSCRLRKEEAGQAEIRYSPRQMDAEIEKRRTAIGPEISDLLGILGEVRRIEYSRRCKRWLTCIILSCFSHLNIILHVCIDSGRDCLCTTYHDKDIRRHTLQSSGILCAGRYERC